MSNLETITNTNGADNASCPNCRNYNAMLGTGRYVDGERGRPQLDTAELARQTSDQKEIYKCRDCGFEAFVVAAPVVVKESDKLAMYRVVLIGLDYLPQETTFEDRVMTEVWFKPNEKRTIEVIFGEKNIVLKVNVSDAAIEADVARNLGVNQ